MSSEKYHLNGSQSVKNRTLLWRMTKALIIITVIFGLVLLNVFTLINDDVHDAGFYTLKGILASVVADSTLSNLLRHSPSQKYSDLQKSNKFIEAQFHELTRVSGIRTGIVKKISPRIARRAILNAAKNLSSVPLEALPLGGLAAMLALTASDINDDCQTMKDLNELNYIFEHVKEDEGTVCGLEIPSLK
ncbi:MAG: hypothetical protein WCP01_16680 [Methylococcaceae bacterium]|jgi:membrane-associated PAP2 superfamily phosphatase